MDETNSATRSTADEAERAGLAAKVEAIMGARAWSKAEVARRAGLAEGTFSQWLAGKYPGRLDNINGRVADWLAALGEQDRLNDRIAASPGYVETKFSREVNDMLTAAQMMPTMVLVAAEAGIGKTFTARRYAASRANAWLATATPYTRSPYGMLQTVARAVGLARWSAGDIVPAIGERLARTGAATLIIIDEAQHLADEAINQVRHFTDHYGAGVALLGNTESYTRFAAWGDGPRYGQLRRRIFKRLRVERPDADDVAMFLSAWGVGDDKVRAFLTGVAMKPGALGQVDMTLKLARLLAAGQGREMTLADVRTAWANRDVDGGR